MKGIAHFLTGVALATCFPDVVTMAREGWLLPVLGGVGGLLPDTLDFKFARYWENYDIEIDPGPMSGDAAEAAAAAEKIVESFAGAMYQAYEEDRPVNLRAHTQRLGSDLWRRYTLRIDPDAGVVAARVGPIVTTGQVPYPGTEPEGEAWATRQVDLPLEHTYSRDYHVDIFTGPSFRFVREGDRLVIHFLDWHHRWSHSLLLAIAVGLLSGFLLYAGWGGRAAIWGAVVTCVAYAGHVLEDQMGYMGCNLFWPLTHRRIPGLRLLHASDAAPNFLVVWSALALVLFNLDRFGGPGYLPALPYLLGMIGLPWGLLAIRSLRRRAQASWLPKGVIAESERRAEMEAGEVG